MKSFKEIWSVMEPEEKQALAKQSGASVNYLSQISCGYRSPGKRLMRKLCAADPRLHVQMFL